MKILTVEEMRAIDHNTSENLGIAASILMENAGNAAVAMMRERLGDCRDTFVCIFVGPGANGGDGLVVGRRLAQMGCHPFFIMLTEPNQITDEAASNYATIRKMGIPALQMQPHQVADACDTIYREMQSTGRRCFAIIDAIFGVGLNRPPEGIFAEAIVWINHIRSDHEMPVIAIDCPSGLRLNTGQISDLCVKADHTACFGYPQPGHLMADGKEVCGELHVLDIGLADYHADENSGVIRLADEHLARKMARPLIRPANCHKGNHGHLLVVGGSPGKSGAALLTARGALRAGAGLATLVAASVLLPTYAAGLAEAMALVIPGSHVGQESLAAILAACDDKSAMALGPGLGLGGSQEKLALRLYLEAPLPLVVDADAITLLAKYMNELPKAEYPRILTPHPGEMGRLLGCSSDEVQRDRLAAVRQASALLNQNQRQHVVLLKGAGTIIASPDEKLFISATGNAGMAAGGMGDVLTGVIGALIGQNISLTEAAVVGAYLHGAAADLLMKKTGIGYLASEVADAIPTARQKLMLGSET